MEVGIEPIGEMVLLAMENAPEKTASGLLLPEEAREKMNIGRVQAVGPDAKSVAVGDRVIFRQYSGTKMEWDGQRLPPDQSRRHSSKGNGVNKWVQRK